MLRKAKGGGWDELGAHEMWPMSLMRYSTTTGSSLDMDSVTWGAAFEDVIASGKPKGLPNALSCVALETYLRCCKHDAGCRKRAKLLHGVARWLPSKVPRLW